MIFGGDDYYSHHDEISRLDKKLKEKDWQPIETIPKDGSEVLACILGQSKNYGRFYIIKFKYNNFYTDSNLLIARNSIKAWIPLPEPPANYMGGFLALSVEPKDGGGGTGGNGE